MIQVLTILVVASLLVRDQFQPALFGAYSPAVVAILTLLPMAAVMFGTWCVCVAARIELERKGSSAALRWADRVVSASRWFVAGWHVIAVLVLGWLDAVRAVTGDLILIDEIIAGLPAIGCFVLAWWAIYPIDRLIREASVVRALDEGRPMHAIPGRWTAVMLNVRHQLMLVLAPLIVLAGWSEVSAAGLRWAQAHGVFAALTKTPQVRNMTEVGLHIAGVLAVFTLMPVLMTVIWDTAPMGEGPTRARLLDLCGRHGVRVRNLLVWQTRGSMLNGAVMGLLGPLRYVLLTDALLERLPEDQVEAVMAHEVGHVRRRHVPWLAGGLLASIGVPMGMIDLAIAMGWRVPPIVQLVLIASALGAGLMLFGWISRRFEWQADAFAAQHLSGHRTDGRADAGAVVISEGAVASMAGALGAVASLNHIQRRKFSWRHGSIQRRMENLRVLIGRPARALRIDRAVGWIKLGIALGLAGVVGMMIWGG